MDILLKKFNFSSTILASIYFGEKDYQNEKYVF